MGGDLIHVSPQFLAELKRHFTDQQQDLEGLKADINEKCNVDGEFGIALLALRPLYISAKNSTLEAVEAAASICGVLADKVAKASQDAAATEQDIRDTIADLERRIDELEQQHDAAAGGSSGAGGSGGGAGSGSGATGGGSPGVGSSGSGSNPEPVEAIAPAGSGAGSSGAAEQTSGPTHSLPEDEDGGSFGIIGGSGLGDQARSQQDEIERLQQEREQLQQQLEAERDERRRSEYEQRLNEHDDQTDRLVAIDVDGDGDVDVRVSVDADEDLRFSVTDPVTGEERSEVSEGLSPEQITDLRKQEEQEERQAYEQEFWRQMAENDPLERSPDELRELWENRDRYTDISDKPIGYADDEPTISLGLVGSSTTSEERR